jgi:hypothetical protein
MGEQPLDPFDQRKLLEVNREQLIPEKGILDLEAYATLIFNIPAQEYQRNIFCRHGNSAILYFHA